MSDTTLEPIFRPSVEEVNQATRIGPNDIRDVNGDPSTIFGLAFAGLFLQKLVDEGGQPLTTFSFTNGFAWCDEAIKMFKEDEPMGQTLRNLRDFKILHTNDAIDYLVNRHSTTFPPADRRKLNPVKTRWNNGTNISVKKMEATLSEWGFHQVIPSYWLCPVNHGEGDSG